MPIDDPFPEKPHGWCPDEVLDANPEWGTWGVDTGPDGVDLVLEADAMMSVFAAERFSRIDRFRRDALVDVAWRGQAAREIATRSMGLELAAALRVTEFTATRLLVHAEALVHRYPKVLTSLEGARVTVRHAEDIVDALDQVEPEVRSALQDDAVVLAETLPSGTFRRELRKLIDRARADTLAERHEAAMKTRRVCVEPGADGMAWLNILAPAVEIHAIHGRVTAIAKVLAGCDDETRTLDELRADVIGDLLIDGNTEALPPEARGIRPTVVITVPALALLDREPGAGAHAGVDTFGFASVEGIGPIPLDRARELCGGASGWMRVLTHPETGIVLSVGRDQYRPPESLRRLVKWRAGRCMAPGCGMPASRCEVDHTIAWEDGGATALTNLAPLCKGHHTVKHHGGWRVEQPPDGGGALEWTSPNGRRYRTEPERRTPFFTPARSASPHESPPPF